MCVRERAREHGRKEEKEQEALAQEGRMESGEEGRGRCACEEEEGARDNIVKERR